MWDPYERCMCAQKPKKCEQDAVLNVRTDSVNDHYHFTFSHCSTKVKLLLKLAHLCPKQTDKCQNPRLLLPHLEQGAAAGTIYNNNTGTIISTGLTITNMILKFKSEKKSEQKFTKVKIFSEHFKFALIILNYTSSTSLS